MKKIPVLLLLIVLNCHAQEFIPLWPKGKMPNSKGVTLEHIEERERITQVAIPGMYAFLPPKEEQNGTSVLILPGGGYHHLTYNLGGFQLAKWLNTQGITAFVLIYRLPTSPDLTEPFKGPIQDAQRAMKLIRANASKWGLHPLKTGVMGTSAGGHLASVLGTHTEDFSNIKDSISEFTFKPDFMILVSAVITMDGETHEGSVENLLGKNATNEIKKEFATQNQVTAATPITFLAHAQDDSAVPVANSLQFFEALTAHNVRSSLHIFPKGEHKISIYNNSDYTNFWKELCVAWLKEEGLLSKI